MKLTVGIAEAIVATAAALAPARVASADDMWIQEHQLDQCTTLLLLHIHSALRQACLTPSNAVCTQVHLRTSRASLGEGKLLVKGCTAHRRHLSGLCSSRHAIAKES